MGEEEVKEKAAVTDDNPRKENGVRLPDIHISFF